MNAIRWLAAAAVLPALAQGTAEFASTAPVTVAAGDALQRAVLPFEAYRDARADLADVRVVNGRGDAVPMAFAGEGEVVRREPAPVRLRLFPVRTLAGGELQAGQITIRASDGTLVEIRGRGRAARPAETVGAYLLDASRLKEPVRALQFDWAAGPGTQVVTVNVEASDDLRAWSPVASAPLVKLEHAGQVLAQRRVAFAPRRSKYYRVTSGAARLELKAVEALAQEEVQPPPRKVRAVRGAAGPKPGEFVFDAGARLPVEALRLVPEENNTVMAVEILTRGDERSAWRPVARATFYRLSRNGLQVDSPALDLPRHAARHWLVRTAPGSGAGIAPPTLELHWRPAQVVFVARGEPPFSLAFGNPDAKPAVLPVSSLIPGYEPWAELRLPEATVGDVASREPPFWKRFGIEAEPRKVVLWSVLIGGVLVLGFMAWRLHRQMRRP